MARWQNPRVLNGSRGLTIVVETGIAAAMRMLAMTQTNNRFLDELAKLMTDAAGAAQGMRREVETFMKGQAERILRDMEVVQREEFEAVKAMAARAREENEQMSARIAALEAELETLRKSA
jgi:BMFP domain-containing protein YqiC